ncbi:MAG: DUF4177 domain-containing protein [Deltaproteobacteria bacterium]|nr:DUF4177 domain-containing protein [Deltaproteobacteria bacterium]
MDRWEYKCVSIWGSGEKASRILTSYGKEGWELVGIWWAWHYLKKPIEG